MKRSFDNFGESDEEGTSKVVLVEREHMPNGISLVNPVKVAKRTFVEHMELESGLRNAEQFLQANSRNKLDIIGKQMQNLKQLVYDVVMEAKESNELHKVACNFVKIPGHTYHLYQRPSGQKYFSMLSPEEWVNSPHAFLGSYRLEADQSWTPADQIVSKYDGYNFVSQIFSQ